MSASDPGSISIRPIAPADRAWVAATTIERWGDETVVGHGVIHRPAELPGFVAEQDGTAVGLLTFVIEGEACEVVTIDALVEGIGAGTALLGACAAHARAHGCTRLWLITTNDNRHARAWYERRGFRVAAVHEGAVAHSRELKPSIPLVGAGGLPITDEIEMVLELGGAPR
jgi:ribosomal protein S18 acetylase RimI-like enzyme